MGPGGTGLGPPDTKLPLLLPPTSRTSQWSEVDELVEPAGNGKGVEMYHKQRWTLELNPLLGTGQLFAPTNENIDLWAKLRGSMLQGSWV